MEFGGPGDGARSWLSAMSRGLAGRCPACGEGKLFAGYTRLQAVCSRCGLDFSGHRADDAPPYVTILIVGHLAIPLALAAKQVFDPPLALQFAVLTPIMFLASALLLPMSKGGILGLQWANRMHGFGAAPPGEEP
jgi:uncharacterized protein (DUF983 family)